MALEASVVNGEVKSTATISTESTEKKTGNSSMDKDAFLQLLVTQMKYQDPLEPQSNTEYVTQFAQFSELEEMQNLSNSMTLQRASALVGQYVEITHEDENTGEASTIAGTVDYVTYENNKAYVSVGGELYSVDDITKSFDQDYANAGTLAASFVNSMNKLPGVSELTTTYKDVIDNLTQVYNDMTDYQKTFLSEDDIDLYKEYAQRMAALTAVSEASEGNESSDDSEAETETETAEATEGA
ncbi:MAG: flagellar hook capping protein [Lachnospiraceae bacterium]|nr:flagellar hook capping protein [Lachnospiraceae bacterium]